MKPLFCSALGVFIIALGNAGIAWRWGLDPYAVAATRRKETSQDKAVVHGRYSDPHNVSAVVNRGLNFLHTWSGCSMASWIYQTPDNGESRRAEYNYNDCLESKDKTLNATNMHHFQAYDTVYVPYDALPEFGRLVLPLFHKPFVLISGQHGLFRPDEYQSTMLATMHNVLNHPHLVNWFVMDPKYQLGEYHTHAKVHPFPMGIYRMGQMEQDTLYPLRVAFLKSLHHPPQNQSRPQLIFTPYLSNNGPYRKRVTIPRSTTKLSVTEYYQTIASSRYVISPEGDRPDCYRHYETWALGAIPIVNADPAVYRHFVGHAIFVPQPRFKGNWTRKYKKRASASWSLKHLHQLIQSSNATHNRNMAFEEYWMEYIDRIVGIPLQWWDRYQGQKCRLNDFLPVVANVSSN